MLYSKARPHLLYLVALSSSQLRSLPRKFTLMGNSGSLKGLNSRNSKVRGTGVGYDKVPKGASKPKKKIIVVI
eukprot:scaffold787_cov231-Alexandrium_tamarense.AAC.2